MNISIARFRANCLEWSRRVESGGEPIDIERRGKIVPRLAPPPPVATGLPKPWERLRGSGQLLAEPGESVLDDREFDALR